MLSSMKDGPRLSSTAQQCHSLRVQDTFEQNLNRTRAEEAESTETFQALRKAKETEIHATEEVLQSETYIV